MNIIPLAMGAISGIIIISSIIVHQQTSKWTFIGCNLDKVDWLYDRLLQEGYDSKDLDISYDPSGVEVKNYGWCGNESD